MDEVIYVESVPRNADTRDHRSTTSAPVPYRPGAPQPVPGSYFRPATPTTVTPYYSAPPSTYPTPYPGMPPWGQYPYGGGVYPPGSPWAGQPMNPYAHPLASLFGSYGYPYGHHGERKIIGNLTIGGAVDLAAEGLAALWPLPAAPTGSGDVSTDVQNHLLYQTALATHTKRDERIRTLGVVLRRLIG